MARKAMLARSVMAKAADGGPVTRAVQDVTGAAEALTVGAVHLARNTLTAAVETVEDVGGRIGSLAVTTVRGAVKAVSDLGGDVKSLAVDAVEGAVLTVDSIGSAAGRGLRDAVTGTVAGVKIVLGEAGIVGAVARRPLARAPEPGRRGPLTRQRMKRSGPPRKTAATA